MLKLDTIQKRMKKSKGHLPHSSPWPSGGSSPQWSPDRWVGTRWPAWSDPDGAHGPWPAGPQSGSSRCRRISPASNNIYCFRDRPQPEGKVWHGSTNKTEAWVTTRGESKTWIYKQNRETWTPTRREGKPWIYKQNREEWATTRGEGKTRNGNWSKGKTEIKGGKFSPPPPPPLQNQNLWNLRLSWGNFYGNKVNFFVHTATDWYHLGDNQVKAPTLGMVTSNDWSPPQAPSNSHVYTILKTMSPFGVVH